MKKSVLIVLVILGMASCTSEKKKEANPALASVATNFVHSPESLLDVNDPINSFIAGAESVAIESFSFEKDNVKLMLAKMEEFESAVIVVKDHTVVLLAKGEDCQHSKSWDVCMPYARGFIKKGELVYQEDFINNLIGKPDATERTIYFF